MYINNTHFTHNAFTKNGEAVLTIDDVDCIQDSLVYALEQYGDSCGEINWLGTGDIESVKILMSQLAELRQTNEGKHPENAILVVNSEAVNSIYEALSYAVDQYETSGGDCGPLDAYTAQLANEMLEASTEAHEQVIALTIRIKPEERQIKEFSMGFPVRSCNYLIDDTVWYLALSKIKGCRVDADGKRPCEKGLVCESCNDFGVVCPYELELKRAKKNIVRFEVGKLYSVEALYGGESSIMIDARDCDMITYHYTDNPDKQYTEQVMYDGFNGYDSPAVYTEALLAWEYSGYDEYGVACKGLPAQSYWRAYRG